MTIYVIGLNHKTAPVAVREKVYFALDKLTLYLQDLLASRHACEAVLLSTCNRSELYCETDDITAVREWFVAQTTATAEELDAVLYVLRNEEAIAHIMEVACGLDSMVVGEPQILGQLKEAYSESCSAGAVDTVFHRLFQQVFALAKDVRTTTAIGACPVSVASAAAHFAKRQVADFAQAKVVLIGAGDTNILLMRYLKAHLQKPITLVNRSIEKAAELIKEFGGNVLGLDQLTTALSQADIVFSATGSAVPIVNKEMVAVAMQFRADQPIMFIDVAVPRDIDPAIAELNNVTLHSIDALKTIIEHNRQGREHAANKALELIVNKSRELMADLRSLDNVSHTIRTYRRQIEALCREELLKSKKQLHQGADAAQVLDAFAHAFTQKLLHAPSVQLRQASAEGRFELLRLAKQLFSIHDAEAELS